MISIFTNPSEMTSANALNRANKVLQSAMERLATGKRINSAADDAAGLQIATRLQGQSNGMTVAQQNISKASSMLQTAEGAFDEVTNILFRMKDLATQGADDTNGASDRDALQSEFTELNKELANILNNTRYGNEKLFSSAVSVTKPEKEVLPEVPKVPEVPKTPEVPKVVEGAPPLGEPQAFKLETLEYTDAWHDKVRLKLTAEDGSRIDKIFTRDDPDYLAVMVYCVNYSAMFQRGETIPPLELKYTRAESSPVKSDTPVLLKSAPADSSSVPWVSGGGTSASATTPRVSELSPIPRGEGGTPSVSDSSAKVDPAPTPESDSPSVVIETPGKLTKALQFQIGAGKDEVMKLDLSEQINDVALAIGELGVAGHDLTTGASANSMIERISDVLNSVGAIRSSLGASINRLGHTSNNLANMKDNTDNSIGVIRDTDYASESSQMTRQQMLAQSSQLMLRQAGSMSSMILNFLK